MFKTVSEIMIALLVLSTLALALKIQPVRAEMIIVPDNYPTIQGAINAANPGDTIYVRSGAHYENIMVNKTVTLLGEYGATRVDGNGTGILFKVLSENCVIEGFTICNGTDGVWVTNLPYSNLNNLTIVGNTIENCSTGIYASANWREGYVTGLNISNNLICENGNGISADCSIGTVCNNSIASNVCGFSGNLFWGSLINNTFLSNAESVVYSNGDLLVSENRIYGSVNSGITISNGYWSFDCTYNISANDFCSNNYSLVLVSPGGPSLGPGSVQNNAFRENYCAISVQPDDFNQNRQQGVIYRNDFVNNTLQIYVENGQPSGLEWDDRYPSGGNYWSDYNGSDINSGPYQNITGPDGLGDSPYIIDANNKDDYPLMQPYVSPKQDVFPPSILNVTCFPSNPNYDKSVNVTARVVDDVEVNETLLFYNYGNSTYNVTMVQNGNNFSAIIAPLPFNTTVGYRICAEDTSQNWAESDSCSYTVGDNTPPEIASVILKPACPYPYVPSNVTRANEPTLVMANVSEPSDASGVDSVGFSYRVDDGQWWNTTMTFNVTNGFWSCTIPGQPGNSTVGFLVSANDKAGNSVIGVLQNFTVGLLLPGDINGDFKVSLQDLVLLAKAYGSRPGDAKWNAKADIDGNGVVDLTDLVILANHYGQHYP